MVATTADVMTNRHHNRSERVAALSGLVFVALLVIHASLLGGDFPTLTDPSAKVVRYLADKQAEIQIGAYLQGLAMVAYLWFLGTLWHLLRPAERGPGRLSVTAVAAAAALIGLIGVHIAILTGLALQADHPAAPDVISSLYLIAFMVLGMTTFAAAALMGALGLLILRSDVLPRWLGGFGLGSAGLWLIAGVGAATDADAWGNVGFLAFIVWLAWTATASVLMARRSVSDPVR